MVCPAEFELGENCKVAIISTAEGDDKLMKYPLIFREANIVLLNKIDLIKMVNFSKERFYSDLSQLNDSVKVIEMSAKTNFGIDHWLGWLDLFTTKERV